MLQHNLFMPVIGRFFCGGAQSFLIPRSSVTSMYLFELSTTPHISDHFCF